MNKDAQNTPNQGDEEVDLIRLLNYFKNGIKSFFRKIGDLLGLFLQFIILLKKNWIVLVIFTALGVAFALYSHFDKGEGESTKFEMVVQSNPISNLQLYAFSNDIKNQKTFSTDNAPEAVMLAKRLGIKNMSIEAIEKTEDIINNYFSQIELATVRNEQTDTLFFQTFDINKHLSNMEPTDFSYQKIKITTDGSTSTKELQQEILNYINNSPVVKNEQQNQLAILESYEYQLNRNIANIDSILVARAISNKEQPTMGSDQLLVNTASRSNVEADLLRYSDVFNRKLHSTKRLIGNYKNGINPLTDLHIIKDDGLLNKPIFRYGFYGFLSAVVLILLLEFNKYLNRIEKKNNA